MILTRQQREALKSVFDRRELWPVDVVGNDGKLRLPLELHHPVTYRQFRRAAVPGYFGDPVVMVPWLGTWLGIEPDGYTHS